MNGDPNSRMFLSVLLLWQLGSSVLVHASPLQSASPTTAHAYATHCTRHDHAAATQGRNGSEAPRTAANHGALTAATDCCTHSSCTCNCSGTPALPAMLLDVGHAVPGHPAVIGFGNALIQERVFEFFRPPI